MATRTQLQKDQPPPHAKPAARPRRRQPAVQPGAGKAGIKASEAMRAQGLGEWESAGKLKSLLNRVDKPKKEKIMLDVLKECGKVLEVYPTPSKFSGGHDPVPVQLVHYVPRPERETQIE